MSWKDPEPIDAFWFAVAPITTVPMGLYSATGYATGDYPYGKPDLASSARNAFGWFTIAASVYGWNLLASPHNATWVSGTQAFKVGGHWLAAAPLIPLAAVVLATAAAVGYVATADVHGGAIATGNPSYGPGIYKTSDPMGEFEEGASGAMNFLFGWMF
jgi:hypothetical protein